MRRSDMSKHPYTRQILEVLSKVGEQGLGIHMIAKHVYNMNCTLFAQPDPQKVYQSVQQFLWYHSKSEHSVIEHTERRGFYRIREKKREPVRQLLLAFTDMEDQTEMQPKEDSPSAAFQQPSLFGFDDIDEGEEAILQ